MMGNLAAGRSGVKASSTPKISAKNKLLNTLMSGGQLWKSTLSWRVAFAVFLTIMAVQAAILALTVGGYEEGKLRELKRTAKMSIIPTLDYKVPDLLSMPFDGDEMQRLIAHTPISGLSVYSLDFNLLGYQGEPTKIFINSMYDLDKTFYSENGKNYEVILRPRDLNSQPYYV
ncbi:MAG: hypothetical protein ACPG05_04655, partial [Bdellovibrionales bacterium]